MTALALTLALVSLVVQALDHGHRWLNRRTVRIGRELIQREAARRLHHAEAHPIVITNRKVRIDVGHCRMIVSGEENS